MNIKLPVNTDNKLEFIKDVIKQVSIWDQECIEEQEYDGFKETLFFSEESGDILEYGIKANEDLVYFEKYNQDNSIFKSESISVFELAKII